jgi:hypothetical protein
VTRKDYRVIATAIKKMKLMPLAKVCVAEDIADALGKAYPNFNREVFLEWCGVL